MERPRFVHFAKLGSARTIHPRSSPASPASPATPCSAFAVAMAPLASSEPDIAGARVKPSAPSVPNGAAVASPAPSGGRVTLLREPVRRSGSTSSYTDQDRDRQSPMATGVSIIPRYTEHRHDRSASLTDTEPRRLPRQNNATTNPNSCNRSAVSHRAVPQQTEISPKHKVINTRISTPNHASPSQSDSLPAERATKTRPPVTVPSSTPSNTQVGPAEDQRQKRASKTTESAIPRVTNTRPALHKPATHSSESPTHSESQSSPQQIRRVLRSSPAFAQFHPKAGHSENGRIASKLGRPNTAKTGSNPSFHSGLSLQGSSNGLSKHSQHARTASETSLSSGGTNHETFSPSGNLTLTPISTSAGQSFSQSSQAGSGNNPKSLRLQMSHKNRPLNLNLSSEPVTTPGEGNNSLSSQSSRRIPLPSARQAESSTASTPNGSSRFQGKTAPSQMPTKVRPKYYQRHADSSKTGARQPEQEANGARTPNGGAPRKSTPEIPKESSNAGSKSRSNALCSVITESPSSSNPRSTSTSKGQSHKQGFGFGYTCTANASIKRKQNNAKTAIKQQVKPLSSYSQGRGAQNRQQTGPSVPREMPSNNVNNGFIDDAQSEEAHPNAFQGSWKRNSMRLATQGYSSMSDLTKSIDCLILGPDPQLSLSKCGDLEEDSVFSSDSCSSQNNTLSRSGDNENHISKSGDHKENDNFNQKERLDLFNSTLSATNNSHFRNPQSTSSSSTQPNDSVLTTSAQRVKGQSCGIPIKQSYFANNSFILVPGVPVESYDGEAHSTGHSSPSGSPSSGYSSSPAAHERSLTTQHDNYYGQQEHQNKIKRRSFVLATSSISDLSYYLDDIDTPVAPLMKKTGNFPSLSTVNETFHTPESQRRQPHSQASPGSGHMNSSFGSFYSCQSQVTPSPNLSSPLQNNDDKRGSFYDNCQESPKQSARNQHDKDGYDSEGSTTESEYKTASSSSFVTKKDLNPAERDEKIRAKLLSRHWVRTTPYRHSRFNPDQALSNYNRYHAQPSPPETRYLYSRTDQLYAQSSSKQNLAGKLPEETRKNKDNQKSSKKSPSPTESRKVPKKRVTSPIAWCTSSRTTENKRDKSSSAEQRKRSNSSPFPNGRLSPSKSREISESTTSPALLQNGSQTGVSNNIYRCQAEAQYSADFRNSQRMSGMDSSIEGDSEEIFDGESDERWQEPPRAPPSLGRPRRKEYAGFDSQPLPMDSFVSDSSSVYTDNTSTCSSRAPSRSADVESYSRRSSIASSTREFTACSRAYSSGASGVLTPRRQMSDDTICNDLSYQGQLGASQHLDDESYPDDITLSKISVCDDDLNDFHTDRRRSQSIGSSKYTGSIRSQESGRFTESKNFSGELRWCASSQSQATLKDHEAAVELSAKSQSCMVSRRRSSNSSSRKSSTSGVSSDGFTEDHLAEPQFQQHQQHQQQKPLTGGPPQTMTTKNVPSKRRYFSSRDILDLLMTPEKRPGAGSTSLSSLEKQAQKICRAILCCNDMNRSMPPREFQF